MGPTKLLSRRSAKLDHGFCRYTYPHACSPVFACIAHSKWHEFLFVSAAHFNSEFSSVNSDRRVIGHRSSTVPLERHRCAFHIVQRHTHTFISLISHSHGKDTEYFHHVKRFSTVSRNNVHIRLLWVLSLALLPEQHFSQVMNPTSLNMKVAQMSCLLRTATMKIQWELKILSWDKHHLLWRLKKMLFRRHGVSKNTEERMFVVDSGASMHMLSKKDLRSDEMDTLRRSRNPTTGVTANGESANKRGGTSVCVHELDLFVTVQLLEETPAVVSLGKLCSEHGCSYEWKKSETPQLAQNGKTITCIMDNCVPLVVPGLSSSSSSNSASTSNQDQRNSQNLLVNPKHPQIQ